MKFKNTLGNKKFETLGDLRDLLFSLKWRRDFPYSSKIVLKLGSETLCLFTEMNVSEDKSVITFNCEREVQ